MVQTLASTRASNRISFADVTAALRQGLSDFRRAPLLGIFFGGVFAAGGVALIFLLTYYRSIWLILPLALGFPLIGPFAAAGLYEVSRRLAAKEPLQWGEILTVVFRQSQKEMGWMAFTVLFIFWIWVYQVRLLLALFMGFAAFSSWDGILQAMHSANGPAFLLVGTIVGAALSFVLFACTVVSMPMLVDRDVDFITAMITSWRAVLENIGPMLGFGIIVAVLTFVALAPFFLGLVVILPVLGHATWALYKRLIPAKA
jgi:uncharacterized membrane protein